MKINKNMKAGFQGKYDSMRAMAERLLNHPGHAKDVYKSKSSADKVRIRPYKEGGRVKEESMKEERKMHELKEGGSMMKSKMMRDKMMKKGMKKDGSMKKKGCMKMADGGSMMKGDMMMDPMMKEQMMNPMMMKDRMMTQDHMMKKGGSMKKKGCMKMAAGGVGKIRHGEATADGKLKKMKKMRMKDSL